MTRPILISEVSIDDSSLIHITPSVPATNDYTLIYRAAMSVRWDKSQRSFYAIATDLDQLESYRLIVRVVESECGERLFLTNATRWANIPDTLKAKIQQLYTDGNLGT